MRLKIETIVNGPIMGNGYVVYDEESKDCVVIDPGDEPERFLYTLRFLLLKPDAILCTHGHIDHCGATFALKKELENVEVCFHKDEKPLLDSFELQSKMFGLTSVEKPPVTRWLEDNDELSYGTLKFKVIHTPGHTPGGVCFYMEKEGVLFSGDTLFLGSIGRTDLPGGSYKLLIKSIKEKLFLLPGETKVYTGHGPITTISLEKETNPFLIIDTDD